MSDVDKLLEVRKQVKSRKATFTRHDSHKKKRIGKKWRRPRGIQSKMRLGLRSYKKAVQIGYGSARPVAGMTRTGLKAKLVHSVSDLIGIDAKKEGVVIAKGVGVKKRVEIVKHAQQQKIKILNIKDPAKFLDEVEQFFKKKREKKEKKTEEKKKKKVEKEKKAAEKKEKKTEEKETIESITSEEDKKIKEKKELDKALTKTEK